MPTKKLSWWEPRWAYVPKLYREFQSVFLSTTFIKLAAISLGLLGLMVLAAKLAFPALQLDFLWRVPVSLVVLWGFMWFYFAVLLAIPPVINIRDKYINGAHGQAGWVYKREEVTKSRIVIFAHDRIRLRFFAKGSSRVFGVAEKINLKELEAFLPGTVEVWDARDRYLREDTAEQTVGQGSP